MSIWIIEPIDPLLFRDGRPFTTSPGATARSLPFPFPSTIAGGVRSQAGLDAQGHFHFTTDTELRRLKEVGIRGPILVQLAKKSQDGEDWLVPAPCDALIYPFKDKRKPEEHASKFAINQLVPLKPLAGAMTDLDGRGSQHLSLLLVGLAQHQPEKPATNTPPYWHWKQFLSWLENPGMKTWKEVSADELGLKGPVSEERVHVAMNPQTRTGRDGFLFATTSLEFTAVHKTVQQEQEQAPSSLAQAHQLGLAVLLDEKEDLLPQVGPGSLGSERRLVTWTRSPSEEPACPERIKQSILSKHACRLILLTPAYFAQGYLPTWILAPRAGVTPRLKAIVNRRPQVVSGWDIVKKGPKQSHRLAPAGTVLYLELDGSESGLEAWIDQIWLRCISDDGPDGEPERYRLDGFGLATLGTWSGQATPIQIDFGQKEAQPS